MRKSILEQVVTQASIIVLSVGLLAYFLQDLHPSFTWVPVIAVMIGSWLILAGIWLSVDFLIGEDEP